MLTDKLAPQTQTHRPGTVRLTRNPTASLEREASHSRVEGILASFHALVDSHPHTASKTSRENSRVSTRNIPVQGRRKRMAISRATCAASDSKDPRYQAALLTRGPGTMRNYRSTVCGRGTIIMLVGKELLLQRAHVSVLCRLQFTLAIAALPVSSRSGFLYGHGPRAGGGCCASSPRVEYSSVASIHSSPRTRSSTRTRAPALASRARGTRE